MKALRISGCPIFKEGISSRVVNIFWCRFEKRVFSASQKPSPKRVAMQVFGKTKVISKLLYAQNCTLCLNFFCSKVAEILLDCDRFVSRSTRTDTPFSQEVASSVISASQEKWEHWLVRKVPKWVAAPFLPKHYPSSVEILSFSTLFAVVQVMILTRPLYSKVPPYYLTYVKWQLLQGTTSSASMGE